MKNRDWDPAYLYELFKEDFFDFGNMCLEESNVSDSELVSFSKKIEGDKYCPEVEDISVDDAVLSVAVEKIERE